MSVWKLADEHWKYMKAVLLKHSVETEEIKRIGFHYIEAFLHGYKHGLEDKK